MASEVCTGETAESLDSLESNCPQQVTDAAEKPDDLQDENVTPSSLVTRSCPTLQESQWSVAGQLAENVYYISHKQKYGERFVAKLLQLKGLSQTQKARVLAQVLLYKTWLCHDYLQSVVDVVEDTRNNRLLVVAEYCEGGSLQGLITRAKTYGEELNEIEVTDWLLQCLSALDHLETQGLVHGKINCGNILLSNNSVKLAEPESFKKLMSNSNSVTASTETTNSLDLSKVSDSQLAYVAPEVANGSDWSSKSDIWSLGCVLYELCTKKRLIRGKSREDILGKIKAGKLRKWPRTFSTDLEQVWRSMMDQNPLLRPSASELLKTPFLAEHFEEMKSCAVIKVEDTSLASQNWDKHIQSRLGNCEVFSDTDFGVDADLELTEEETLQLLNLGKS